MIFYFFLIVPKAYDGLTSSPINELLLLGILGCFEGHL